MITSLEFKNDSEIVFIQYPPEPSPAYSNIDDDQHYPMHDEANTDCKLSEEMETAVEGENDANREGSNEPIISTVRSVSSNDNDNQCAVAESHCVPADCPYPLNNRGKDGHKEPKPLR